MPSRSRSFSVGLISDTHGLLRPRALSRLAPVTAVRGNNDTGPWTRKLRDTATVEIGPARIYVLHDLKTLAIDPAGEGFGAVVSGHSHKPVEQWCRGECCT